MTQATTVAAPAPAPATAQAAAAAATQTPATNVVTTGQLTMRDVAAFRARRTELSSQLNSAVDRRKEVQQSLRGATGADKAGLEQRLGVLDSRIARIEADIEANGRQLASIEAMRVSTGDARPDGPQRRNNDAEWLGPIGIAITMFVFAPIAFTFARNMWKRGGTAHKTANAPENNERLVRMEQAIDSIAIEIERVSEGQRFVTRLLAEGRTPAQVGQQAGGGIASAERVGANR